MKEFHGRVAVIRGAASGIGRGIANRCARAGMNLVLADLDTVGLATAETELEAQGARVLSVKTDVSKRNDVEALARQAYDVFGQVHLLFNNAGVSAGGPPWEATWNDWEWTIGVNLWGVIHGVKVFIPLMQAQNNECHIINTSSTAGLIVGGFSAPYSVTRHAVVALSESMYLAPAAELAGQYIGTVSSHGAHQHRRGRALRPGSYAQRARGNDARTPGRPGRFQKS